MAKKKSNKSGKARHYGSESSRINQIIAKRLVETMLKIRGVYHPEHEYFYEGFTCPSCEQDFIKEQVGTVTNLIGGWYCEKENLGVCYMLCPSCSQVAAYGTVTQQEKQEQVINKNLLDAWIKTK